VLLAAMLWLTLFDAQTPQPAAAFAETHASAAQVVKNSRIVFICVKPQYVKVVLEEVRELLTDDHVIVSIAAGVPIAALKVLRVPPESILRMYSHTALHSPAARTSPISQ